MINQSRGPLSRPKISARNNYYFRKKFRKLNSVVVEMKSGNSYT